MIDTLTLEHDQRSVKRAREFVAARLAGHDHQLIENATLMVSELVTNSVKHATGAVTLTLRATDDIVRVDVHDQGPASPVVRSPSPDDPAGRGLRIVARLSDEWGFESIGASENHVWFLIQLDGAHSDRVQTDRRAARAPARPARTSVDGTELHADGLRSQSPPGTHRWPPSPDPTARLRRHTPQRCASRR